MPFFYGMALGQLYKIPIRDQPPGGHDPQGDLVWPKNNDDPPVGFIVRQCGDKYMIMLATPDKRLPKEAEILLQYGDIVQVMREEAACCKVTREKLKSAAARFPDLAWVQQAVQGF